MRSFAPEFVFHMAAQSVVLHSYDDPVETYSTNVLGTVNVLEAIRRLRRPCIVINVTTDKCYENKGWDWGYRENDKLAATIPTRTARHARNSWASPTGIRSFRRPDSASTGYEVRAPVRAT